MANFYDYDYDNPYANYNPYQDVLDRNANGLFNEQKYVQGSASYKAEVQKYKIQHYDQLKMIADQRAYDHPLAQRARLLAAGYNPDLVGSQSDVGSGASSSVPGIAASSMPDVKSPVEGLLDVASGIASFTGGLSSLFTGLGAAVDFAGQISSYKDRMDSLHSSSVSAHAQAFDDRISLYGRLASAMNPKLDAEGKMIVPDLSEVIDFCKTMGIAEDTGVANGLHKYLQNPFQQKIYEDGLLDLRRSTAARIARPMEFVQQVADLNASFELTRSQVDAIKSNFSKIFSEEYFTDDNAQTLADVQSTSLKTDQKSADFRLDQLNRDIDAFENRLNFLDDMRRRIAKDKQKAMEHVLKEGSDSRWLPVYQSLCIQDAQFAGLRSDMLHHVYGLANQLMLKEYTSGYSISDGGNILLGNRLWGSGFYNFIGTMFDSSIGVQSDSAAGTAAGAVISTVNPALGDIWDYLRSHAGAGPSTTANNNTTNVGPHHTIINQ